MNTGLTPDLISECQKRLLQKKSELLNRIRASTETFKANWIVRESSGDEIDQTVSQLEENHFIISHQRMREQIVEIEMALARIENGYFGLCEETDEPIEKERLLAIPWTRVSIEGAEIREAVKKRFAKRVE